MKSRIRLSKLACNDGYEQNTLKKLNKKTNLAYNFLKEFNSFLTGDTKTNELE